MLLVHPDGLGSKATNSELNIAFDNPSPNYSQIARAASGDTLHAACVQSASELEKTLKEAIDVVKNGTAAVVEVKLA